MAGIPRIAWRNLGRNRRRTGITGAALAVGISLSVVSYGVIDGMLVDLLDALTGFDLGHVQAHHPDYPQRRRMRDTVPRAGEILAEARATEGVEAASARLYGYALVASGDKSLGAELVGVDPEHEPKVTTLHEQVVRGSYLDREPTPWPRGRELSEAERERDRQLTQQAEKEALAEIEALVGDGEAEPEETPVDLEPGSDVETQVLALAQSPPPARPPRVMVGASLAKILGLEVGDTVHATGQAADGTTEEVELEVAGVFRTGTGRFDRSRIYLHLSDLQRFTRLYDRAHEIALVSDSPAEAGALASTLRDEVGGDDVLIRSWQEIRPDIANMLDLSEASAGIMVFIIVFVATLGVVNTMLMAVFERTRELGMLKAIGMSGGRIVLLIVTETLFLVLLSAAIGTALGLLFDWYLVVHGIDLGVSDELTIGGVGMQPVLHAVITPSGVIMPTAILAVTTMIASLYPALRAARLRPAVGMRET